MSNQITLAENKRDKWMRCSLIVIMLAVFFSFAISTSIVPAFATDMVDQLVENVIGIVETAAGAIGLIIVIWGFFQIVLAFRREDSEGISKQITTVVVGGVLMGFGELISFLR